MSLNPELAEVRNFVEKRQYLRAMQAAESYLERDPCNFALLLEAVGIATKLFLQRQAYGYLVRARQMAWNQADALHSVGQYFRLLRFPRESTATLCRVLELKPTHCDALLELALASERKNRLEEAEEFIRRRLAVQSADAETVVLQSRLCVRRKQPQAAIEKLRMVVNSSQVHVLTRSRAACEMAGAMEQLDRFEDAWYAMLKSKQLIKNPGDLFRPKWKRILTAARRVSGELCTELPPSDVAQTPKQNVLLTGIPRSGTTLTATLLSKFASLVVSDEYELFQSLIWPGLLGSSPPEAFDSSGLLGPRAEFMSKTYVALREIPPQQKLPVCYIDKNPSLSCFSSIFSRLLPNSCVITVRRNLADTLISCLKTYMPPNMFSMDLATPEQAVERLLLENQISQEMGRAIAPEGKIEIGYEQLVQSSDDVICSALDDLGLESNSTAAVDFEVFSPNYAVNQLAPYASSIGGWRKYERWLNRVPNLPKLTGVIGD